MQEFLIPLFLANKQWLPYLLLSQNYTKWLLSIALYQQDSEVLKFINF